jgi:hypothetical protein
LAGGGRAFVGDIGRALNSFRSLPYIRMYGKVSRPFFLSNIDHIVTAIRQFAEVQLLTQRQLKESARQSPGGKVANKEERKLTP